MIRACYEQNRGIFLFFAGAKVILLLFLVFQLPGFLYADTEYTQYMSYDDISAAGTEPNPSDKNWIDSLTHVISPGNGLYWQGSDANGDCYLQFDLSIQRPVNCFKIMFYQSYRRYRFKIAYNNTTTNPDGVYFTARTAGWSTQTSEDTFVSFYLLDGTFSRRFWRVYFYGNDGENLDPNLCRIDEVRIYKIDFHILRPISESEWTYGNYHTIYYSRYPYAGDPRDYPKRIEVHKGNEKIFNISANIINSGFYRWLVGSDTDPTTTKDTNLFTGSDYRVKVVDLRGYGTLASDYFTIINPDMPEPTQIPSPPPTQTPSPSPTPEPTETPTPAPTPPPRPDPGLGDVNRDGEYELYVVYSNRDEDILATFYKDNQVDTQLFQVEFTEGFFFDNPDTNPVLYGMAKHQSGYYLKTRQVRPNRGAVYFRNENRPDGVQESDDFRIRVVTGGNTTVRPGDDIQLRFGVSGFPAYDAAVGDGDFMAVYDKKLLWRANLNIDERIDRITGVDTNTGDWNDRNPWNVNNNVNSWNIDYDDENYNGITNEQGDGGQITLKAYTWHHKENNVNRNTNRGKFRLM